MKQSVTHDCPQSLAELTGVDWGVPPPSASFRTRERLEARRMPLGELNLSQIGLLLEVGSELDWQTLVPFAIGWIEHQHNLATDGRVSLLIGIMATEGFNWSESEKFCDRVRELSDATLDDLDDQLSNAESSSDHLGFYRNGFEILRTQNLLFEAMIKWERAR